MSSNPRRAMNEPETSPSCTRRVRLVVRASLKCSTHSSANRRHAQLLVCKWVRAKWPRLATAAVDMDRGKSECSVPGQALSVLGETGSPSWTLSIASTEPKGDRVWMTTAKVAEVGDTDVMDVHTSCTDSTGSPLVVAPPSLLRLWVRDLDLDDGGVPIIGERRVVEDRQQAEGFCDHVRSETRTLPIIALVPPSPGSNYYGVDPAQLAETLSGLAHVACIGSPMLAEVAERLGPDLAPVAGAARIYEPHSNDSYPNSRPIDRQSLIRQPRRAGAGSVDAGVLKRALIQRACALSADASKGVRLR